MALTTECVGVLLLLLLLLLLRGVWVGQQSNRMNTNYDTTALLHYCTHINIMQLTVVHALMHQISHAVITRCSLLVARGAEEGGGLCC